MIFSSSRVLADRLASLAINGFLGQVEPTGFFSDLFRGVLICFSHSFSSSCCISISLLMVSNSRLFFTFSLCFSYFFDQRLRFFDGFFLLFDEFLDAVDPSLQPLPGGHVVLRFHLPGLSLPSAAPPFQDLTSSSLQSIFCKRTSDDNFSSTENSFTNFHSVFLCLPDWGQCRPSL